MLFYDVLRFLQHDELQGQLKDTALQKGTRGGRTERLRMGVDYVYTETQALGPKTATGNILLQTLLQDKAVSHCMHGPLTLEKHRIE